MNVKKTMIIASSIIGLSILILGLFVFVKNRDNELHNQENEDFELIAHAMGSIDGVSYTNSKEAFEYSYIERNIRIYECDLVMANDGKIVLRHDWEMKDFQQRIDEDHFPDTQEFLSASIYDKYTALSFEDLLSLLVKYPDITIVADGKAFDIEAVRMLFAELDKEISNFSEKNKLNKEDIIKRFIIEVHNEDMYNYISSKYSFDEYIFSLYSRWDGEDLYELEKICLFCKRNNIKKISMWNYLYNELVVSVADRFDISIILHSVNDYVSANYYKNCGVAGIFTDELKIGDISNKTNYIHDIWFFGDRYNADYYIVSGMSSKETDFSWTNANTVRLFFPNEPKGRLRYQINLNNIYGEHQSYKIHANGQTVAEGELKSGDTQLTFELNNTEEDVLVTIELPDAKRPCDDSDSIDTRLLSLAIRRIIVVHL